jgi:hypothetical protein
VTANPEVIPGRLYPAHSGRMVAKPEVMASCRDTKIIYEDAGPKLTARHQAQLRPVPWQSRCTCALLTRCWKPQAQTLRAE